MDMSNFNTFRMNEEVTPVEPIEPNYGSKPRRIEKNMYYAYIPKEPDQTITVENIHADKGVLVKIISNRFIDKTCRVRILNHHGVLTHGTFRVKKSDLKEVKDIKVDIGDYVTYRSVVMDEVEVGPNTGVIVGGNENPAKYEVDGTFFTSSMRDTENLTTESFNYAKLKNIDTQKMMRNTIVDFYLDKVSMPVEELEFHRANNGKVFVTSQDGRMKWLRYDGQMVPIEGGKPVSTDEEVTVNDFKKGDKVIIRYPSSTFKDTEGEVQEIKEGPGGRNIYKVEKNNNKLTWYMDCYLSPVEEDKKDEEKEPESTLRDTAKITSEIRSGDVVKLVNDTHVTFNPAGSQMHIFKGIVGRVEVMMNDNTAWVNYLNFAGSKVGEGQAYTYQLKKLVPERTEYPKGQKVVVRDLNSWGKPYHGIVRGVRNQTGSDRFYYVGEQWVAWYYAWPESESNTGNLKVDDIVRVVSGAHKGQFGKIVAVFSDNSRYTVKTYDPVADKSWRISFTPDEIQKFKEESNRPKFHIGDRVFLTTGSRGRVDGWSLVSNKYLYDVRLENGVVRGYYEDKILPDDGTSEIIGKKEYKIKPGVIVEIINNAHKGEFGVVGKEDVANKSFFVTVKGSVGETTFAKRVEDLKPIDEFRYNLGDMVDVISNTLVHWNTTGKIVNRHYQNGKKVYRIEKNAGYGHSYITKEENEISPAKNDKIVTGGKEESPKVPEAPKWTTGFDFGVDDRVKIYRKLDAPIDEEDKKRYFDSPIGQQDPVPATVQGKKGTVMAKIKPDDAHLAHKAFKGENVYKVKLDNGDIVYVPEAILKDPTIKKDPLLKEGDDAYVRKDAKKFQLEVYKGDAATNWNDKDRDDYVGQIGNVVSIREVDNNTVNHRTFEYYLMFPDQMVVDFCEEALQKVEWTDSDYGRASKFFKGEMETVKKFIDELAVNQLMAVGWDIINEFGKLHTGEERPFSTKIQWERSKEKAELENHIMTKTRGAFKSAKRK